MLLLLLVVVVVVVVEVLLLLALVLGMVVVRMVVATVAMRVCYSSCKNFESSCVSPSKPGNRQSKSDGRPTEDAIQCVVCFDARRDCAFTPCGHLCVCMACADGMEACPLCRATVQNRSKIYG